MESVQNNLIQENEKKQEQQEQQKMQWVQKLLQDFWSLEDTSALSKDNIGDYLKKLHPNPKGIKSQSSFQAMPIPGNIFDYLVSREQSSRLLHLMTIVMDQKLMDKKDIGQIFVRKNLFSEFSEEIHLFTYLYAVTYLHSATYLYGEQCNIADKPEKIIEILFDKDLFTTEERMDILQARSSIGTPHAMAMDVFLKNNPTEKQALIFLSKMHDVLGQKKYDDILASPVFSMNDDITITLKNHLVQKYGGFEFSQKLDQLIALQQKEHLSILKVQPTIFSLNKNLVESKFNRSYEISQEIFLETV